MKNKYNILFWVLLAVLFMAKIVYIGWGPLDLSPDEAHYWDWSRYLDMSYYSKGPFIAYNIFAGVKLGSWLGICPPNPAFWVRFPAVINALLLGIISWLLAQRLWRDKRTAFGVILLLASIPIYAVGSILITIDNPLMLFWAAYIFLVFTALSQDEGKYWYGAGIVLGLGMLTKYTMLVMIPCILGYLISNKQHRRWLRRKEFYLGLVIAGLFFLPVLLWNFNNNWVGLKHLLGQAGAGAERSGGWFSPHLWEFIGLQLAVVSPLIFVGIIIAFVRSVFPGKEWRYKFLWWLGAPLGIFYLILSLHKACQPNWPAPAYFTGVLLLAVMFWRSRLLKAGVVLGLFLWLLVFLMPFVSGIPNRWDPTVRLRGWQELGTEVGRIGDDFNPRGPYFIFSDTYQITSELAFYVPGQPKTYCVDTGRRMNQYDLWQDFSKLLYLNAIYVKHRDQDLEPQIEEAFESCHKLPLYRIRQYGRQIHCYSIFLCRGFKGFPAKHDEITY